MSSYQSTLGDEGGIAEELAEGQQAISIAEFFEKNKHMLGFDSGARGLVTAVKEGVDNALDACEEADIFPDIYVEIRDEGDYYRLIIEDNGPGITREQVPKVFGKLLYGSRFHRREQSLAPDQELLVKRDGSVESVPIGVLCDAYLPEEGAAAAPVVGDVEVPSFDRGTHEMTWQPVTRAIRHETDGATYRVETAKGRSVEVTGDHSVFTLDAAGGTVEVAASELESGDVVLAPRDLPETDRTLSSVNLLEHLPASELADRRMYVYGLDEATIREIEDGETVRKYPSEDSDRRRYYYRYEGVDVLKDSLRNNYLEDGYLPAWLVKELGWEQRAADCELRTYQVGGDATSVPVTVPVSEELMELVGYYVAEGHAGPRQVGFTFGSHETDLVESTERAVAATVGTGTTTVERERNSTRVKAFGSPLALFLKHVCGDTAAEKRVPGFVFHAAPEHRRQFLRALHEGDGSDSHPSNELSHTTVSETLARQVSTLWNSLGVLAASETVDTGGYADGRTYRTKVFGADAALGERFELETEPGEQAYKRVPTALLEPVAVGEPPTKTVPDTLAGLLYGCGVGASLDQAAEYRDRIEAALAGEAVPEDRYASRLERQGLLTAAGEPTPRLDRLWDAITDLQGVTDTDVCLLKVTDVERTDPPEYVYDVSVPGASGDDENFVVANTGALCVKNSRGQQGIGISAAVLYSQLTSGKPAKITSRPEGADRAQYFELIVDTDENEPEVKAERELAPGESDLGSTQGTRIELEMEANMRARRQLHDYVEHTAVVNPHARLTLVEPGLDEPMTFERAENAELPAETEEIRPHPHGVELGALRKMIAATNSRTVSGFLQEEFTRVGRKTAGSVVAAFEDRHLGRQLSYPPPRGQAGAAGDLTTAVRAATANKPADATKSFARSVADRVDDRERVAHRDVREAVEAAADDAESEFDARFGATVREKATAAAWGVVTGDADGHEDRRGPAFYRLVDEVTTDRKADRTVERVADRLATRVAGDAGGDGDGGGGDGEGDAGGDGDGHDRLTRERLREYVDWAADGVVEDDDATFGDTAREKVVDAVWEHTRAVPEDPPSIRELEADRDATADLLAAMRRTDIMSPPTDCLSPITAELVEAGLRKEYDADFYAATTRDADVTGGDPFIVEAGIAYGGELDAEGAVDVMRFANRVPLVYQRGACAITDVVKSIGWRNYELDQPGGSGIPNGPAVVMVHVASTNVPFTSESKDAVANVPEIESEIELAIREAARDLKSFLKKRQSMQKRRRKQDVIATVLPEMARKVAEVTDADPPDIDNALARIMNNVLVDRSVREDGDGREVTLVVENHADATETPEVTDVLDADPDVLSGGDGTDADADEASVVEVGGEYVLTWRPELESGDRATLTYRVPTGTAVETTVDGVEDAKLTLADAVDG